MSEEKKMKQKRYIFGRVLCTVVMILCVLVGALYATVALTAPKALEAGKMPSLFGVQYISVTDNQFDQKLQKDALVLGKVRESYAVGDVVAVALTSSDMIDGVQVVPNTIGKIALAQISQVGEATYAVCYNDVEWSFFISEDAVLSGVDYQFAYLGYAFQMMLAPLAYIFWLLLPVLLIVLCIVILSYLKEKRNRWEALANKTAAQELDIAENAPQEDLSQTPKASKAHPLLSGKDEEYFFGNKPDGSNDEIADQISQKIAMITAQGKKDQENIEAQSDQVRSITEEAKTSVDVQTKATGDLPAQPKTTVVYQVGEQVAQKQEDVPVSEDDLDLLMLQDKIENIIHNNNRRLQTEAESKLRGVGTEKEIAKRELEKTREFFISPTHLNQKKK